MDCDFDERLSLLHDNELAEGEAALVRAHVETCARCRAAWQQIRELGAALRVEGDALPPPSPAEQLGALTAILTSARAPLWRRRVSIPVPVLGGLVVATMVLAFMVTVVGRGHAASPAPLVPGGRLAIEVVKRPADADGGWGSSP
jgi:anti-sigma factor RsiW